MTAIDWDRIDDLKYQDEGESLRALLARVPLSGEERAAVVQACTAAYSLSDTLAKLERLVREAKEKGAQLAVFPEAL